MSAERDFVKPLASAALDASSSFAAPPAPRPASCEQALTDVSDNRYAQEVNFTCDPCYWHSYFNWRFM
jgi:hypothetical protein